MYISTQIFPKEIIPLLQLQKTYTFLLKQIMSFSKLTIRAICYNMRTDEPTLNILKKNKNHYLK